MGCFFCFFWGILFLVDYTIRNRSDYVWFSEKKQLQTWSVGNFGFNEYGGVGFC